MLKKEEAIDHLSYALAVLVAQIEHKTVADLYDSNRMAEDFFARLLSVLYGFQLKNLNLEISNFPGGDVGDRASRVLFQVSSDGKAAKIQDSIDKFVKHGLDKDFDHFKVLVIGRKQGVYNTLKSKGISFDADSDIIDTRGLVKQARSLDGARVATLISVLKEETKLFDGEQLSDAEALAVYRSNLDRRALTQAMHLEGSMSGMSAGLTELVELLTKGTTNGNAVAKPKWAFKDKEAQKTLQDIYQTLNHLRSLYEKHVRSGEISEEYEHYFFHDSATKEEFDELKRRAIKAANKMFASHGISPIVFEA